MKATHTYEHVTCLGPRVDRVSSTMTVNYQKTMLSHLKLVFVQLQLRMSYYCTMGTIVIIMNINVSLVDKFAV